MLQQWKWPGIAAVAVIASCGIAVGAVNAQEKKEEEFWEKGRPKNPIAAKMARIVWALLRYGTTFEPGAIAI